MALEDLYTPASPPQGETSKTDKTPQDDTTGETFLVDKPTLKEHPLKRIGEEAFEYTPIPTFIRKGQGTVHAIKEGDPELGRRELLGVAGAALLNAIPDKWILGPLSKGAKAIGLDAAVNWAKNGTKEWLGPFGNFVDKYVWNNVRKAGNYLTGKPQVIDSLDDTNLNTIRTELTDNFNKLTSEQKQEIAPIMRAGGNVYANRDLPAYSKYMKPFEEEKEDIKPETLKESTTEETPFLNKIPKKEYKNIFEGTPQPLYELPNLGPVSQEEQKLNLAMDSVVRAFKDPMDLTGSSGWASPAEAKQVYTDKFHASQQIDNVIDRLMGGINQLGKKYGINDLADRARLLREEPSKIAELPEGVRYVPIVLGRLYNAVYNDAKARGSEVGFRNNYVNRLVTSIGQPPKIEDLPKRLSDYVKHTRTRHWELPLNKLKAIQEGTIKTPVEAGLPGTKEGQEEFDAVRKYLIGKQINLNASDSVKAYLHAWLSANQAESVDNILGHWDPIPDLGFVRGKMSIPEYQEIKNLVTKTMVDHENKLGRDQTYNDLNKIHTLLQSYREGSDLGLPSGNMYHPDAVKLFKPLLASKGRGEFMQKFTDIIRILKSVKLAGSFFHMLSQNQTLLASGAGLNELFYPKTLKELKTNPLAQRMLDWFANRGLNLPQNNKIFQEAYQMTANELENAGGPNTKKILDFLQNNIFAKETFEKQLPAFQYLLAMKHMAQIKLDMQHGLLPNIALDDIGRMSSYITNFEMGSLRPEIMSKVARDVGEYYLIARNWTYRNTGLVLNAMHEWFVKTPAALGFLPKELSDLFKGGLNSIQSMENLSPEAQDYVRKQLADFMAIALSQRMWRVQLMSYMMSGHSTFANEQGHETDIDTGFTELKKSPSGKLTPHKIYLSDWGMLNDAFNLPPITPPIGQYQATKNPWIFANPLNYADPMKFVNTARNKGNAMWNLTFNILGGKKPGETALEGATRITKDVGQTVTPIPLQNLLQNWNMLSLKYGPETALEIILMGIIGQPRVIPGSSPQTNAAYRKQAKKTLANQIGSEF